MRNFKERERGLVSSQTSARKNNAVGDHSVEGLLSNLGLAKIGGKNFLMLIGVACIIGYVVWGLIQGFFTETHL